METTKWEGLKNLYQREQQCINCYEQYESTSTCHDHYCEECDNFFKAKCKEHECEYLLKIFLDKEYCSLEEIISYLDRI